jgi:hypothetical protein
MLALSSRSWIPSTSYTVVSESTIRRRGCSCNSLQPGQIQLTCFTVIEGFHDFSSSRIDRQIVPDG